jgi:hypothetical protein
MCYVFIQHLGYKHENKNMKKWSSDELLKYNQAQIEEILRYKWIESEKQKRDIGLDVACREWIAKYAHRFREYWEKHRRARMF